MTRLSLCILLAWAAALFAATGAAEAQTEKRRALLIGLQHYDPAVGPLENPHKDVDLLADTLAGIGFEVTILKDSAEPERPLAAVDIKSRIIEHARAIRDDLADAPGARAVSFVYYSGHGAANAGVGKDYIIPQDALPSGDRDFWASSLAVKDVLDTLEEEAGEANHIVVFDACRNELRLSDGTRNLSKGFSALPTKGGMLVSYTTAAGATASDGDPEDPAGPYASVLAREIEDADGQRITPLFVDVNGAMVREYGQRPIMTVDLQDAIFVKPGDGIAIERDGVREESPPETGGVMEASSPAAGAGESPTELLRALVISNEAYEAPLPKIDGAHDQADEMAAALQVTGFDVVQLRDPSRASLAAEFKALFEGFDSVPDETNKLAVVYYFGHARAAEAGGSTYLIPTGAPVSSPLQLRVFAPKLGDMIDDAQGLSDVDTMVFVETCSDAGLGDAGETPCAPLETPDHVLVTFTTAAGPEDGPGARPHDRPTYSAALSEELIKGGSIAEAVKRADTSIAAQTIQSANRDKIIGYLGKDIDLRRAETSEVQAAKQAPTLAAGKASAVALPGASLGKAYVKTSDPKACFNSVQDKIAWDAAGAATRWASGNVEKLCDGAPTTTYPGACFDTYMKQARVKGSAWRADWRIGLALCAGTPNQADLDRRVNCLRNAATPSQSAARSCAAG